jgi:hypothetical protein
MSVVGAVVGWWGVGTVWLVVVVVVCMRRWWLAAWWRSVVCCWARMWVRWGCMADLVLGCGAGTVIGTGCSRLAVR